MLLFITFLWYCSLTTFLTSIIFCKRKDVIIFFILLLVYSYFLNDCYSTETNNIVQENKITETKYKHYYFNFTVYKTEYKQEDKYIVDEIKIIYMEEDLIGEIGINKMSTDTVFSNQITKTGLTISNDKSLTKQINHSGLLLADNKEQAKRLLDNYIFNIYKNNN